MLSYLLRRFHVTALQKNEELRPNGELILRSEKGITVLLSRRQRNSSTAVVGVDELVESI